MHCEIHLHTPPNGAFIGIRGNVISGVIRYAINVPMIITGISASIEGTGILKIEYLQRKDEQENPETEIRRETYLDVNIVPHNIGSGFGLGIYEMPFRIVIPHDIPPSLNYQRTGLSHNVCCNIRYYIKITFSTSDFFSFGRRFRKEINIISGLVPKLPMTPVIYGGDKKLTHLFSSKKSYVKVKTNIFNSVLRCGDKVQLQYEVVNDTNVVIKRIKIKVVEIYTFKSANGDEIVMEETVPDTETKTASLECGETQEMLVDINLPVDRESLEFANIVTREYFVLISVKLPMPHRNYELKIPIQIGHTFDGQGIIYSDYNAAPLWELMNEDCEVVMVQQ